MRILGTVTDWGGCSWYRVVQPLLCLQERGYDVDYVTNVIRYDGDVIIIPRISSDSAITFMYASKEFGKRVVLDFDDNYHRIPQWSPCFAEFNRTGALKQFEEGLAQVDAVTCSTEPLADFYREMRPDIQVAKNFVWSRMIDEVAPPPEALTGENKRVGQIRIGYAASYVHTHDIASIRLALEEICRRYPQVVLVSLCQKFVLDAGINPEQVECHDPVGINPNEQLAEMFYRYYNTIGSLDLDIGIAPLQENEHNLGKSNIRLLEYGINGIPIVASDYGPYADKGFRIKRARSIEDWVAALEYLIEQVGARGVIAKENLAHIRREWTEEKQLGAWEQAWAKEPVKV